MIKKIDVAGLFPRFVNQPYATRPSSKLRNIFSHLGSINLL